MGHEAQLFRRQVVKVKNKPPVEVAISVQRPVVDVRLLLAVLHPRHPAASQQQHVSLRVPARGWISVQPYPLT